MTAPEEEGGVGGGRGYLSPPVACVPNHKLPAGSSKLLA